MAFSFIIISGAIAGLSALWRNLQEDIPAIRKTLDASLPWVVRKSLTCGFCFTYWTSFFAVLLFNPLASWKLPLVWPFQFLHPPLHFLASWMALGIASCIIRFGYIILQELVHLVVRLNESHFTEETKSKH